MKKREKMKGKKLEELKEDKILEVMDIEAKSMRTKTTFPFTEERLRKLYKKKEYKAYGYRGIDGVLEAKVGFKKVSDRKFELDVCVRPDKQNMGIGGVIIVESIKQFLIENDRAKIFLYVHPENPAFRLYKRLGFVSKKNNDGEYQIIETDHGPRIIMN